MEDRERYSDEQIIVLFSEGLRVLGQLASQPGSIRFRTWSQAVTWPLPLEDHQPFAAWLWRSLCESPEIIERFGDRLMTREQEWKERGIIPAFPGRSWFSLAFSDKAGGTFTSYFVNEEAMGFEFVKGHRLGVENSQGVLHVRPVAPALLLASLTEEKDRFRVRIEDITVDSRGTVCVQVDSVSKALTVARNRLRPDLPNSTGSIYIGNVKWYDGTRWLPVEDIRDLVEADRWVPPLFAFKPPEV